MTSQNSPKDGMREGGFFQHIIFKVTVMYLSLTTFSVALRLWCKLRTGKRTFGVDDASMLTAWIFYIIFGVIVLNITHIETHDPVLTLPVANRFLLQLTLGEALFMLTTVFLKISLMLYYRQFVWKKWQRQAIVAAGACSIILSVVALFVSLFQCGATLSHMAQKQASGQCIHHDKFVPLLYLHGATGAITDWAFALLPISVLIKSSLAPHIKLSICILLVLGVTGSIAACFRTAYIYGVWFEPVFLDPTYRPTFYDYSAPEILLALSELGFGISAASLACLQPLLRHFVHKAQSWFEQHKHLCSWRSPNNSTAAIKSHAGLLPNAELRARKRGITPSKTPIQIQTFESETQQQYPPHPAVRRHGISGIGGGINGRRKTSISRRKSSLGILPTLDSIVEKEEDFPPFKPRCSIGVLPTIATEMSESDFEGETAVNTPISGSRIVPTLVGNEMDSVRRVDSQAIAVC